MPPSIPLPPVGYDDELRSTRVTDTLEVKNLLGLEALVGPAPGVPIFLQDILQVDQEVSSNRVIGRSVYEKYGGWDGISTTTFDSTTPNIVTMGVGSHGAITQTVELDDTGIPSLRIQLPNCDNQMLLLPYTGGPFPSTGELRLKIRNNNPLDFDGFAGFAFYNGLDEAAFRGVVFLTACSPGVTALYVMNGSTVQVNSGSMSPSGPPPVSYLDTAWYKVEFEYFNGAFTTNYPPFRVKCDDGFQFMGAASRGPWVFDVGQFDRFSPGTVTGFLGSEFTSWGLVVGRQGGTPTDPIDFNFQEIRVIDRLPYVRTEAP